MAISEKICWTVLKNAHGRSLIMGWTSPGEEKPKGPPTENAIGIGNIKKELVLHHSKQEIEDSLYFLEHRGYLTIHSIGIMGPPMMYSLTQKAIDVLEGGSFSEEEETAFKEAWVDLKPGTFGIKFNLWEIWRRFKKWLANLDRR